MVQDPGAGPRHPLQGGEGALEVRDENLHLAARAALLDGEYRLGEAGSPTIAEVVPGNGGDDGIAQPQALHDLGHPLRLLRVGRQGQPAIDGAEATMAGADVTQDEEGGRAALEALPDVGAVGLLADG